jgi:hypothetical protein
MKITLKGKENPESIELNETYFEINNTTTKVRTQIKAAPVCTANIIPNKVAIPFPPRNPAKTGNKWPITAVTPSASW